ncbi:hypothetical protein RJ639_012697 [Escallonia herrerae]|uniref:F-box domain-containing protein n=1 Tax=Escallonia herrerae TaxID=1293975 RepID=A0AA88VM09_9ASTE|nr:hypothetical protein RJ639_012697 [Escallonia herrerae]
MSNGVNLPEDIVEDILTRLPATSLGRFRCVSKPWRARISHPLFVKTHLSRSNHRKRVLVRSDCGYLYSFNFDNNVVGIAKILNFLADASAYFGGSCNGLVLIVDDVSRSLLLFNPTTQESSELPASTFQNPPRHTYGVHYGLGYDSGTDDYKVVKVIYDRKSRNILVDIYETKSGCWRGLKNLSYPYFGRVWGEDGIFANGSLHWLAGPEAIIAFDLAEEKFSLMPLPSGCMPYRRGQLVVLDGCVGTICWSEEDDGGIWLMKEHGAAGSWIRFPLPRKGCEGVPVVQGLWSLGDGKILLNDYLTRSERLRGPPKDSYAEEFVGNLWTKTHVQGKPIKVTLGSPHAKDVKDLCPGMTIPSSDSDEDQLELHDQCYGKIVAFDLVEERLCEMPVPCDCVPVCIGAELVDLDGCLSIIRRSEDVNNVWVMKEYGATGSWTRSTTSKLRVLCSVGDGKILLNDYLTRYFWCNVQDTRSTEMMLYGLPQGRRNPVEQKALQSKRLQWFHKTPKADHSLREKKPPLPTLGPCKLDEPKLAISKLEF